MEVYVINKNVPVSRNLVFSGLGNKKGEPLFETLFEAETFEEVAYNKDINLCIESLFRIAKKEYSSISNKLDNFTFFFWKEQDAKPLCVIDVVDMGQQFNISVFKE